MVNVLERGLPEGYVRKGDQPGVAYYSKNYPSDHWAMQGHTLQDENMIAIARYGFKNYAIYLNPTDRRGYRCVVSLLNNGNPEETFNRPYSFDEEMGLGIVLQLMRITYQKIFPIAQTSIAGNNSHSFDAKTGLTLLGSPNEPSMLHGHCYGRGNREKEYLEGVPLGGPLPKEIFDMRGKSPEIIGNETKETWKDGQILGVSNFIQCMLFGFRKEALKLNVSLLSGVFSSLWTDITFVRHGETDWNLKKITQGNCDVDLNGTGINQAQKLKDRLKPEHEACYSSDLLRAVSTAKIITDLKINTDKRLRERDYKEWTGKPQEEYLEAKKHGSTGAETNEEMIYRINDFLVDMLHKHPGQKVLFVTHGGVIRNIVANILQVDVGSVSVDNTGVLDVRFTKNPFEGKILSNTGVSLG